MASTISSEANNNNNNIVNEKTNGSDTGAFGKYKLITSENFDSFLKEIGELSIVWSLPFLFL